MADPVELRMSVTSIKRVDPYVKEILATSSHVALYQFNPLINEWERTETEGALFLYNRSGEPWHSIMIMNRLNTNNLIEPIVEEFEHQMQSPFLLYRNSKNKIYGIWFYNRDECVNITYLLESLMEGLKEKQTEKTKKRENRVDIFSMLTKAQEEFTNKTPNKSDYNSKTPNKSESVPQYSSTPRAPDVTSQSVMDFFAKASTKNVTPAVHVQGSEGDNLLQRLMSNPAHSVEHIEKQQRSITPHEISSRRQVDARRSIPISFNGDKSLSRNGLNDIRIASPNQPCTSPLSSFLNQAQNLTLDDVDVTGTSPLANYLETPQKLQLMPPMMFASSFSNKDAQEAGGSSDPCDSEKGVDLLTRNQILQAMTYLLKNDPDFITKLHEAYVKSVNEKLKLTQQNTGIK
ncbi:mRNA-decapping enzyme 1A [Agrilus planipennis]|uniref:mRNA-decapping enzyme 1A n=1 Tax=Agrilus planipennis TaxID=224129 RepID=A0A1W4XLQ9_AGRPL|nr:mRNA-decapping enzyme 1A [Agrilus planipennis]